jgi:hypothetical protein
MTSYAWTIAKPGRQSIKKVGHRDEMLENLRVLNSGTNRRDMSHSMRKFPTIAATPTTKAVSMNGR